MTITFPNNGQLVDKLQAIADTDVSTLDEKDKEYGSSWKKRGGVGAFMMVARKWDRLENAVGLVNYDIFQAVNKDSRNEGILDDIADLRRYLLLIEEHCRSEMTAQVNTRQRSLHVDLPPLGSNESAAENPLNELDDLPEERYHRP